MEKEVEVYRRNNHNGHLRLVKVFESLEDLADHANSFDNFSCDSNDRHTCGLFYWDSDYHKTIFGVPLRNWKTTDYCYVAYNAKGKIVPPDVLVGVNRNVRYNRARKWYYNYTSWSKRGNGHYFRRPKTLQEKRWASAWDDEEFAPRTRAKRTSRHIPDSYWDLQRNWDGKSWKNYRKHQWKEKRGGKSHP